MKKIKFNKNNFNDFSSVNYAKYAKNLGRKKINNIGNKPFIKKFATTDIYTILEEALFPEQFQERVHEYLKEDYPELFPTREEMRINIAINLWKKKISSRGWNTTRFNKTFETREGFFINEIDDLIWIDEIPPNEINPFNELFDSLRIGLSKYYIENFDEDDKNE